MQPIPSLTDGGPLARADGLLRLTVRAGAGGLERLRGYRKRWVRATRSHGGPLHDGASHGAVVGWVG